MHSISPYTKSWTRLLAILALLSGQGLAQQVPEQPDDNISRSTIEARLDEVRAITGGSTEEHVELVNLYRKALAHIDSRDASQAAADAYVAARNNAPDEARRIRVKNERAATEQRPVALDIPTDADVESIQRRLQDENATLASLSADLQTITNQITAEDDRPTKIRQRIAEADSLASGLDLPPSADESPYLIEAKRWAISAQISDLNAESRKLNAELLSQPMRLELLDAQKEAATDHLRRTETRLAMLQTLLAQQRRDEAAQVIAQAQSAVVTGTLDNTVVAELAGRNQVLADQLEFLNESIDSAMTDTNAANEWTERIRQQLETAQYRMEVVGLNPALGLILHEQRRDLPKFNDFQPRAKKRQALMVESGMRDIQYEAELRELLDPPSYLDDLFAQVSEDERNAVRGALTELIAARHTLMRSVLSANTTYFRALGAQDFAERQLVGKAREFDTLLSKRLLWLRSVDVIGLHSLKALPQDFEEFATRDAWVDATSALIERLTESPALGLAFLIAALLLVRGRAIKRALRDTGRNVGIPTKDDYRETLKAAGLTILLMLPLPLVTLVASLEISQSAIASNGAKAIGDGLSVLALSLAFLMAARAMCISGGLVEMHFGRSAKFAAGLRRQLRHLMLFFLMPAVVVVITIAQDSTGVGNELSRLMFIIASLALVHFSVRMLRPATGLLDEFARKKDPISNLPVAWLIIGAGLPAMLAVAAMTGYLYSAITLLGSLTDTLWLLLGLTFVHEMVSRGLIVMRQRLLYRERLAEWEASKLAHMEDDAGEDIPLPPDDQAVDVTSLDTDARKLLNMSLFAAMIVGLSAIWMPVLPALSILEDVTLWTYREVTASAESIVPVTLANLVLVLIILVATIFAARSIPSLLEALLRQRAKVDAGSRLAFATLTRYVIVLIGVVLISDNIGFQWSQIQWLVAALGVGIGFGLQEIIANFISGLIILVERPIRVGDVVTIGDVSGKVSRLQIRATTIINWDRQEMLVPNKEFITGRVLNWTLSDEVVRIVTTVGVSYGSDVPKAMSLVAEAVAENDRVLQQPKPLITLERFGDNSLDIMLRCFVGSMTYYRETKSVLHQAINDKLNAAGITIAFPQRDVHIDTAKPLDIRIQETGDAKGE
jgi:potassium efflux system protein